MEKIAVFQIFNPKDEFGAKIHFNELWPRIQKRKKFDIDYYIPNNETKTHGLHYIIFELNSLWRLLKHKYKVIYARSSSIPLAILIYKLTYQPNVILEINGDINTEIDQLHKGIKRILYKKIFLFFEKLLITNSIKVISVNENLSEILRKRYSTNNIITVNNGVNTKIFNKKNKDNKLRKKLKIKDNHSIMLFVGGLFSWQGLDKLFYTIKMNNIKNFVILIIGDGPEMKRLKKLSINLKINCEFLGQISHNLIPKYINLSDYCVAPMWSNRTCSPLKIYEYLACHKPVITTKSKILLTEFKDNSLIYMIDFSSKKEFSKAITEIKKTNRKKQNITNINKKININDWDFVAEKIINIISDELTSNY